MISVDDIEIGKRFAEIRKKYNYTQEQWAERVDYVQVTVARLEKGLKKLDLDNLYILIRNQTITNEDALYILGLTDSYLEVSQENQQLKELIGKIKNKVKEPLDDLLMGYKNDICKNKDSITNDD